MWRDRRPHSAAGGRFVHLLSKVLHRDGTSRGRGNGQCDLTGDAIRVLRRARLPPNRPPTSRNPCER